MITNNLEKLTCYESVKSEWFWNVKYTYIQTRFENIIKYYVWNNVRSI